MYKHQQVSFVYTECSDMAEVFVSDSHHDMRRFVREFEFRRESVPYWSAKSADDAGGGRRAGTCQTYPQSLPCKPRQTRSVRFKREPPNHKYCFKQVEISSSPSASKIKKNHQFLVPASSLLDACEYEEYLKKSSQNEEDENERYEELHGCCYEIVADKDDVEIAVGEKSPVYLLKSASSSCSSTLTAQNSSGKSSNGGAVECHVVGDLLSFASNTMRYFDNPDLSDIILLVGESRFYAHKFALAAQSDIFRDMLLASDRCGGSCPDFQKELELQETKDCELVFIEFLRFFYCGRISFTPDTALPLLVLASKYRVEALRTACDSYISNLIEDGDLKNSLRWLKYATRYQLHDLTEKCVDGAISDYITDLVESNDWILLSIDCIDAVLHSSCLLIPDEFYLYEALQRWFMVQRKNGNDEEDILEEKLKSSLQKIRFSQMLGSQLMAVEESPLGRAFKSCMKTCLSDAYRFQILSKENRQFQDDLYLARDYTDKQHCVQINYNPNKQKKAAASTFFDNGKWEIQPRRYYDTLNIVIVLKKPLEMDMKVYVSILIYKRNGGIQMRLRRKACLLRAFDSSSVRSNSLVGGVTSPIAGTQRPNASNSAPAASKEANAGNSSSQNPHRPPHGPATKLHGPHNGQEYYAIDNIISDTDFQVAASQSGTSGIKLGVIIRTWAVTTE